MTHGVSKMERLVGKKFNSLFWKNNELPSVQCNALPGVFVSVCVCMCVCACALICTGHDCIVAVNFTT